MKFLAFLIATSAIAAQAPKAFEAAGVYWTDPSVHSIRARASSDGAFWTDWLETHGELVSPGRYGSGLLYFGPGQHYLEVEGLPNPEIFYIDTGHPSLDSEPVAPRPPTPLGITIDRSAPPIVSRAEWGCTSSTCPAKDPAIFAPVTHLIVHHTDGNNTAADWKAVVRSIWVLHVQGNGWNDVGYNFLIDPNGVLYEGRAGGDGVIGAHFSGVNTGTMGVALLGTYVSTQPSDKMLATLEAMLGWQADKWKLDPLGVNFHAASALQLNVISGHRDAGISPKASGTTECPGNTAYTFLPALRTKVASCVVDVGEPNRCFTSLGGELAINPNQCGVSATVNSSVPWLTGNTIQPNTGTRRSTTLNIAGRNLSVTQAGAAEVTIACVAQRGVVNAADFDPRPVARGSTVAIFGTDLSNGIVAVNGRAIQTTYTGPAQINAILPTNTPLGTNHLTVNNGPETNFWVTEAMPAVFTYYKYDSSILVFYLTGAATNVPWSVAISGRPAGALFLGPAPGFPGIYQANVELPADLKPGEYVITFTVNGVSSRDSLVLLRN